MAPALAALAFLLAAGCSREVPGLSSMLGLDRVKSLAAGFSRPESASHLEIVTHETPTGLKVLIGQTPGVAVATLDAWVATGSADEPTSMSGASHFLEHMLFKGSGRFTPGEMSRFVEGLGGELNAATSQDSTHFYITVPSENVGKAMDALADALIDSTIDPGELEKERAVVLEEIAREEDSPVGVLSEAIDETAFLSGPYRRRVLGGAKQIAAMSRRDLLDYYHRRYTPQTVVLAAIGDLNPEQVAGEADRAFAGFHRPLQSSQNEMEAMRWNAGADVAIPKDAAEAYLAVVYPGPSMKDPEFVVAADVLQSALAAGRASRLCRELKERRQIVSAISAEYPTLRYDSCFAIVATAAPERVEEFRGALQDELARVCREKLSGEELDRAKRLLINDHDFSKETSEGAASVIGYYYTLTGSLDFEAHYVKAIQSVSAGEVRDAARRIFLPENAVRITIIPKKS